MGACKALPHSPHSVNTRVLSSEFSEIEFIAVLNPSPDFGKQLVGPDVGWCQPAEVISQNQVPSLKIFDVHVNRLLVVRPSLTRDAQRGAVVPHLPPTRQANAVSVTTTT